MLSSHAFQHKVKAEVFGGQLRSICLTSSKILRTFSDLNFQLNSISKPFLSDLAMGLGRIFFALALIAG